MCFFVSTRSARERCCRFLSRRWRGHLAPRVLATFVPLKAHNKTLLSHALASLTIPTRPFGVFEAPTLSALVTAIRLALRSAPSRERAFIGAITLTTIASGTEIRRYAAASTEKTANCLLHTRTTLNRQITGYAALMLHSDVFSDVVSIQPSLRGKRCFTIVRGPCPCQYPSVLSAVKNSRAMLAAAPRRS